ncbi:hypothetical protein Pla110_22830 [Polystyrenella longa]|uniref:Uncharacterized protein n=1 Tax=Polystyrenella longa TaxID=2528007 RepID=A0A518CMU7_9PLAN|nr:hypothetical protein [Polystyrenella longa]QDU80552.1 hypothetical protein Pla110_22830 [Polystyrenella longa]
MLWLNLILTCLLFSTMLVLSMLIVEFIGYLALHQRADDSLKGTRPRLDWFFDDMREMFWRK